MRQSAVSNLKSLALGVLRFCFSAVKFLSALAADGTIPDVEAIISSNLSSGFDSLKRSVTDSMASQEKTMAAVQVLHLSFFCFMFYVFPLMEGIIYPFFLTSSLRGSSPMSKNI